MMTSAARAWVRCVFVIDRAFEKAAAFALAGTVLAFFGFIHGEGIGVAHISALGGWRRSMQTEAA